MDDGEVRIRLKFTDPRVLSPHQISQGLDQSWYLVRFPDVSSIADVAAEIASSFHLDASCPNGLGLEVDGFVLPPCQSAHLLKDSDLVRIHRAREIPVLEIDRSGKDEYNAVVDCAEFVSKKVKIKKRKHDEDFVTAPLVSKEFGAGSDQEQEYVEKQGKKAKKGGSESVHGRKVQVRFEDDDFVEDGLEEKCKAAAKLKKIEDDDGVGDGLEGRSKAARKLKKNEDEYGVVNGLEERSKAARKLKKSKDDDVVGDELERRSKAARKLKKSEDDDVAVNELKEEFKAARKLKKSEDDGVVGDELERSSKAARKLKKSEDDDVAVDASKEESEPARKLKKSEDDVDSGDGLKERSTAARNLKKSEDDVGDGDGLKEGSKAARKMKKSLEAEDRTVKRVKVKKSKDVAGSSSKAGVLEPQAGNRWTELLDAKSPTRDERADIAPKENSETDSRLFRTPMENGSRPSRSARRKKSKRLWLREQAKLAPLPTVAATHLIASDELKAQLGASVSKQTNGSKVQFGSPLRKEVEGVEAEEEVLPIMVGAGHIRFASLGEEDVEEEEALEQQHRSLPLRFGAQLKSKRQGQNWGQEKKAEKSTGKRWMPDVESSQVKDNVTVPFDCEKFPFLEGLPMEGDVLTYRLVELAASWTPQLSPYRVGVVVSWDPASQNLKLDPHPDHPLIDENDEEDDALEEFEDPTPPYGDAYDETGSLESHLSALVEVRLVQREIAELASGPTEGGGEELDRMVLSLGPLENVPGTDEAKEEMDQKVFSLHQVENIPAKLVEPVAMMPSTGGNSEDVEDMDKRDSEGGWQESLALELEHKKLEISRKDGFPGVESEHALEEKVPVSDAVGGKMEKAGNGQRAREGRKSKYLRSAGVGSIVALLRAQQVL